MRLALLISNNDFSYGNINEDKDDENGDEDDDNGSDYYDDDGDKGCGDGGGIGYELRDDNMRMRTDEETCYIWRAV